MLIVNESTWEISLTRGDTARLTVTPKYELNGDEYVLEDGDKLTFTVKRKTKDTEYLIQKTLTDGDNVFHIAPKDTKDLTFGEYKYDVQLTTSSGDVYTIIGPCLFRITEEVSW